MPDLSSTRIRRRRATLDKRAKLISDAIVSLQQECRHLTPQYAYRGSSGNYDPSNDHHWVEWACFDCGCRWTTDQSIDEIRKYPGAVEMKRP